jgi:hypothetical protein
VWIDALHAGSGFALNLVAPAGSEWTADAASGLAVEAQSPESLALGSVLPAKAGTAAGTLACPAGQVTVTGSNEAHEGGSLVLLRVVFTAG